MLTNIESTIDLIRERNLDFVITYPGRFQPPHKGHKKIYDTYNTLFPNKVYPISSNLVEYVKSPLDFKMKKELWNLWNIELFEEPKLYAPSSVLEKFDKEKTVYFTLVGHKDIGRLNHGKYYKNYLELDINNVECYPTRGYYIEVDLDVSTTEWEGKILSSTFIRNFFKEKTTEEKIKFFKWNYGLYDKKIFDKLNDRLSAI